MLISKTLPHGLLLILLSIIFSACSVDSGDPSDQGDKTAPVFTSTSGLPAQGDVVKANLDISWVTEEENPARVEIHLINTGIDGFDVMLANVANSSNSGTFTWDTFTAQSPDDGNYQLRLIASDIPGNTATVSSGTFNILNNENSGGMTINIGSPLGGQGSPVSGDVPITWTGTNLQGATVDIELLQKVGGGWDPFLTIATGIPAEQGSYTWKTGTLTGLEYKLIVTAKKGTESYADAILLTVDNIAPSINDTGLKLSNNNGSFQLEWKSASDNFSSETNLKYQVIYSDTNPLLSLDTLQNVNQLGLAGGFGNGARSLDTVVDLMNQTFNVVVEDQAGNQALYESLIVEGMLNPQFNQTGIVNYDSNNTVYTNALTTDGNNNIYVAGKFNGKWAIWKYTAAGQLDSTFGNAGVVVDQWLNAMDSEITAISIDSNSRIVMCGNFQKTTVSSSVDMMVWRLLSTGAPDTNFNFTGYNTYDYAGATDDCVGLALDPNNNVYLSGSGDDQNSDSHALIVKFSQSGSQALLGGNNAIDLYNVGGGNRQDFGGEIVVDSGYLVGIGYSDYLGNLRYQCYLWKFDLLGNPQNFTATNNNIVQVSNNTSESSTCQRLKFNSNRKFVIGGYRVWTASAIPEITLFRFNEDGTADSGFSGNATVLAYNTFATNPTFLFENSVKIALNSNNQVIVDYIYTISDQFVTPKTVYHVLYRVSETGDLSRLSGNDYFERGPAIYGGRGGMTYNTAIESVYLSGSLPDPEHINSIIIR